MKENYFGTAIFVQMLILVQKKSSRWKQNDSYNKICYSVMVLHLFQPQPVSFSISGRLPAFVLWQFFQLFPSQRNATINQMNRHGNHDRHNKVPDLIPQVHKYRNNVECFCRNPIQITPFTSENSCMTCFRIAIPMFASPRPSTSSIITTG